MAIPVAIVLAAGGVAVGLDALTTPAAHRLVAAHDPLPSHDPAAAHHPKRAHHRKTAHHRKRAHHARAAKAWTSPSSCTEHEPAAPFVGVSINPPITQYGSSFASATGVRPAVVEFYDAFGQPFAQNEAAQAASLGAMPLIQLDPHVSVAAIADGQYDSYLRHYAGAVKSFGCQIALSFGHEMNGDWYPWGLPRTSPATFIAAWRHIHHIFATEHVRNVIWSWDPDHAGTAASEWWPGANYVNWIGLDGYLRPGETFQRMFDKQLTDIRSFTSKPVYLAETAVAPGPDQVGQISSLFAAVTSNGMAGLTWFDLNAKEQWRLEGDPTGISAFHKAVSAMER